MTPIAGIWAASLTPMREDLSVDFALLVAHVSWLLESGCHGVVLLGTTGEANSFSVEERVELMERVAASGLPLDRIIVGTGCAALPDTVRLTSLASRLEFRAVLLLPPFYYKDVTDDGLYEGFQRLMDSVGSSSLEILLYHFPRLAGVGYSLELISRLRTFYPSAVVGIKDSTGDPANLSALCTEFPGFSIMTGTEKLLVPCLEQGGAGCISASVNVTSSLCRRVYDDIIGGVDSDEIELVSAFRTALDTAPFVPGLKYLMADRMGMRGWNLMRPPLISMSDEAASNLDATLSPLPILPNYSV